MTTHSLERALQLSRRVAMLAGGQIRYDAPTAGMSAAELAATYAEITERRPAGGEPRR